MKRIVLAVLALGLMATSFGCHAEGDVQKPSSAAQIIPGR